MGSKKSKKMSTLFITQIIAFHDVTAKFFDVGLMEKVYAQELKIDWMDRDTLTGNSQVSLPCNLSQLANFQHSFNVADVYQLDGLAQLTTHFQL